MKGKKLSLLRGWWSDVLGTREYKRYLEKEDRKRRLAAQFFTFATIVLGVFYLVWHWQHINWDAYWYALVFFFAEVIGLVLFCFFSFNAWFLRYHARDSIAGGEEAFSVDIFIPVAGEPLELVRMTVEAAARIDFEKKQVYILDDKADPQYEELARRNGCVYLARTEHRDAKAGNLNYALLHTQGDLILALDADQVPQPQIIARLIGYFRIPKIAFVQTKQDFNVPVEDPFGNTDRVFYNVMQSGKDGDNAAFSCGSGVMYRRKALEEIGGFSTWNIVEDVHTSMLLHERGWRSVYYNYPLTFGTSPTDVWGVYRQRKQWAADSLRMLFWDNPFLHKGLTLKQKLQYANLGFVYLVAAFVMPFYFITPAFALLSNKFVLTAPVSTYVVHRLAYFIGMSIAYGLVNYPTSYMKAFQMWTGLFPVFIQATWIALRFRKRKPVYRVNIKPTGAVRSKKAWVAIIPQMGIILLGLFSVVYAFLVGNITWDFYLLNLVWVGWSVWTMSGICLAALRKPRWSKSELPEKSRTEPGFFARVKELVVTVALALGVTLFFVSADPVRTQQFLTNLHEEVLGHMPFHKTEAKPDYGTPQSGNITGPIPENPVHVDQTEKR